MTDLPETCPKCGASGAAFSGGHADIFDYDCGSYSGRLKGVEEIQFKQSQDCLVKELKARVHELEEAVNEAESESNRRGRVIAQYEEEHRKTRS